MDGEGVTKSGQTPDRVQLDPGEENRRNDIEKCEID
jgi:hypothetical protein